MEFFDAFFERFSNSISSFNQSVSCAFVQLISRPVEVDSKVGSTSLAAESQVTMTSSTDAQ